MFFFKDCLVVFLSVHSICILLKNPTISAASRCFSTSSLSETTYLKKETEQVLVIIRQQVPVECLFHHSLPKTCYSFPASCQGCLHYPVLPTSTLTTNALPSRNPAVHHCSLQTTIMLRIFKLLQSHNAICEPVFSNVQIL